MDVNLEKRPKAEFEETAGGAGVILAPLGAPSRHSSPPQKPYRVTHPYSPDERSEIPVKRDNMQQGHSAPANDLGVSFVVIRLDEMAAVR
jgi:hypothetical protein